MWMLLFTTTSSVLRINMVSSLRLLSAKSDAKTITLIAAQGLSASLLSQYFLK